MISFFPLMIYMPSGRLSVFSIFCPLMLYMWLSAFSMLSVMQSMPVAVLFTLNFASGVSSSV